MMQEWSNPLANYGVKMRFEKILHTVARQEQEWELHIDTHFIKSEFLDTLQEWYQMMQG